MFTVQQIRALAIGNPGRLAVVMNGFPVSYGEFWLRIAARRRELAKWRPVRGTAIVWVDSLLETWSLLLAMRSLGFDTVSVQDRAQCDLFSPQEVDMVVSLGSEPARTGGVPAGLDHLVLGPVALEPDGTEPELGVAGGHIMLTSGTTGQHKKVRTVLGGADVSIERMRRRYGLWADGFLQPDERSVVNVFNMAAWTAGGHNWPIFAWSLGGAVVFEQSGAIHRALAWPGISHCIVTPWYLTLLMALEKGAFALRPEMQILVLAGAVSPSLAQQTMARLSPRLLVGLGSTEQSLWAGSVVRSDEDLRWYRVYPDRHAEVVDDAGNALGPGQLGRVRVGLLEGDATGYVGDPVSSAAHFADGWFYPGDLGLLDHQGRVTLHGRASDVIEIHGEKHAAEPMERAIQARLECDAVCLITSAWRTGADEMYVFIESRRPIPVDDIAAAVRGALRDFPEYRVYCVESLPRTETGKIKRIALAQMLRAGAFEADPSRRY